MIGTMLRKIQNRMTRQVFHGSATYWEERYRDGGTSGAGSTGRLARMKSEVLNGFVARHGVQSVLELGCGDGEQLSLATYPAYVGVDVSDAALELCRTRNEGREGYRFCRAADRESFAGTYDLVLSLDVIYHLVEDAVYEAYLADLFDHAGRFVVIYSSDYDAPMEVDHVRHRRFSEDVAARFPDWRVIETIANPLQDDARPEDVSCSDFYVYAR